MADRARSDSVGDSWVSVVVGIDPSSCQFDSVPTNLELFDSVVVNGIYERTGLVASPGDPIEVSDEAVCHFLAGQAAIREAETPNLILAHRISRHGCSECARPS